ncbi:glycosyltransferase [Alienimonas chondri]|uniref:glycosyltransferase n=1 Tax=Alienimonas chondri TaxID=2681879 RepID=UPI001488CAAB|nr:glycosyltransferase [Alienimonas chondri]
MPRVLSVIATLDGSGAEKQFALLNAGLQARGWDMHAVALTRGGPNSQPLDAAGVPLTVLHKALKFDPLCLARLRRIVAKLKPDVIHSWMFTANAYARMASGGRPVVTGERCVDRWKGGWQHAVDRRLIGRTARVVGNSQAVADFAIERGAPADLLTVIPNGVEPLTPDPSFRANLLSSLQLPPDSQPVVFAGRLASQKRPEDLIWAFQLLHQANPSAVHLIVGEGPLRERCERQALHFGHAHRCRFLGHRQDAAKIIAAADVLWLASEYEGQSNTVMEAMSAGVVPIVSDIPSNRELVADGETGFVVKVGDSLGFCQFADRLLSAGDLRSRMGAAAGDRMREEFSVDVMLDRYEALYRELLDEKAGP